MQQKTFPELLIALLVAEYGKTEEEAKQLTTKHNDIVVRGIMAGTGFVNLRATAMAIDMKESNTHA